MMNPFSTVSSNDLKIIFKLLSNAVQLLGNIPTTPRKKPTTLSVRNNMNKRCEHDIAIEVLFNGALIPKRKLILLLQLDECSLLYLLQEISDLLAYESTWKILDDNPVDELYAVDNTNRMLKIIRNHLKFND